MKRRRFLETLPAVLTAVRARALVFLGTAAAVVGRDAFSSGAGDPTFAASNSAAEEDWIARSTGPGVLWAHDFRHDEEFHNFHRGNARPYERLRTAPQPMPLHATLVPTSFGESRAIRSSARGTHLVKGVPAAARGATQVWYVADITKIPEPWDGPYILLVSTHEYVEVQSRDVAKGTITVKRGATRQGSTRARAAGTTIGSGPQGRWIRPTAALPAGTNGKPTDDIGITNGSARKTNRAFTSHWTFREGYFGHRSYWDPAHGPALYKDWKPNTATHNETRYDAWEGDEFYLQFRAKISGSRFKAPSAKMIYIQCCSGSGNQQYFWGVGPKGRRTAVPGGWPHGEHGNFFRSYTCWGDGRAQLGSAISYPQGIGATTYSKHWLDGEEIGWQQNPDVFPDARYKSPGYTSENVRGWHFPADKWVTYLVHMKYGRDSVVQYAQGVLLAPVAALDFSQKDIEVLRLDSAAGFPDVNGAGNYEYYVHSAKSRAPQLQETMKVIAVDRVNNTLTVQRNAQRATSNIKKNTRIGWDTGSVIAYGPYQGFPGVDPKHVTWPDFAAVDKRLQLRETTVEVFVAVEGEPEYTKLTGDDDKYAWLYGDGDSNFLGYLSNPPGVNAIELSQYINDYVGSGAVAPPSGEHDIQYTQAIFSRQFIPPPRV